MALKDTQTNVQCGLGTFTYTIPVTDYYGFRVSSWVNPDSDMIITINKNGTPLATSPDPLPTQTHVDLSVSNVSCTLNDAITVVLSSAAAVDNQANTVKSIIGIMTS